jgi:hypothetical protein
VFCTGMYACENKNSSNVVCVYVDVTAAEAAACHADGVGGSLTFISLWFLRRRKISRLNCRRPSKTGPGRRREGRTQLDD